MRMLLIEEDPEGVRALADAYRSAVHAMVAAEGRADDPAVLDASRTVARLARGNPSLEPADQDEFVAEFHFGDACGPASHPLGALDASGRSSPRDEG